MESVAKGFLTIDLFLAGSALVYFVEFKESFAWDTLVEVVIGIVLIISLLLVPLYMWSWMMPDQRKKQEYVHDLAVTLIGSLAISIPTLLVSYFTTIFYVVAFLSFGLWGGVLGLLLAAIFMFVLAEKTGYYRFIDKFSKKKPNCK